VNEAEGRERVVAAARRLHERGGESGALRHAGLRWGIGFLVTPSGLPCGRMRAEDIVRVALAERVEALARLYCRALQVGEPVLLDEVEMAQVVEKFRAYGRQPGFRR